MYFLGHLNYLLFTLSNGRVNEETKQWISWKKLTSVSATKREILLIKHNLF